MEKEYDITVKPNALRERLDVFLSREIGLSRSQVDKLIKGGQVKLNNGPAKHGYRIKTDDRIIVKVPPAKEIKAGPEDIPLNIIYEDKDIIVINKPPGIVVHPAAGNAEHTLVNALLHHCRDLSGIGGSIRPGVVHRLDKDTSGLIVFAKNNEAHINLARQIKSREVKKIYLALVYGEMKSDSGVIDAPLGRHPVHRKKMAVINSANLKKREALTHYRVIKKFSAKGGSASGGNGYTLVELDLKTGRTHQIRVHLSYIGHPVVGDKTYSKKKDEFGALRQLLHASRLELDHPITGKYLEFRAEIPGDMERVLGALVEYKSGDNAK
ncbi:MAG: RluA family pseudouridine synthase [bacterium]